MDFSLMNVLHDAFVYWDTVANLPAWAQTRNTSQPAFCMLDDFSYTSNTGPASKEGTVITANIRLCPGVRLGHIVVVFGAKGTKAYSHFGTDHQAQIPHAKQFIRDAVSMWDPKALRTAEIHLKYICQLSDKKELKAELMSGTRHTTTPCFLV